MSISIKISDENHKKLKILSEKTKWSMKDLIDRALENFFIVKKMSTEK